MALVNMAGRIVWVTDLRLACTVKGCRWESAGRTWRWQARRDLRRHMYASHPAPGDTVPADGVLSDALLWSLPDRPRGRSNADFDPPGPSGGSGGGLFGWFDL